MAERTLRWDLTGSDASSRWSALVALLLSGRAPSGLQVRGSLDLSGLRIRALPPQLTVTGDLDLRQCERLRRIGDDLHVGGHLMIGGRHEPDAARANLLAISGFAPSREGVTPLVALPDGLEVGGTLALHSCHQLTELPADIRVGRSLDLIACRALRALPGGLHVPGSLTVRGQQSLVSLPTDLRLGGDLVLQGAAIEALPAGLTVPGNLILVNCRRLKALPEQLRAQTLRLAGSPLLSTLPPLKLSELRLERLPALRALPPELRVSAKLRIKDCPVTTVPAGRYEQLGLDNTAVQALPDTLVVERRLSVQRSPLASLPVVSPSEEITLTDCELLELPTGLQSQHIRLSRLPLRAIAGLTASGELRIDSCPELRRLGEGVRARSLSLRNCPRLEEMRSGLALFTLSLIDCPALRRLPERLTLQTTYGRALTIEGCRGIEELPAELACSGTIEIAGSGLRRLTLAQADLRLQWRGQAVPKDHLRSAVGRGEDLAAFFRAFDVEVTLGECRPFAEKTLGRKLGALRRIVWRQRAWEVWGAWHFIAALDKPDHFALFTRIRGQWSWFEGDRDTLLATVPDDLFERATTEWDEGP